MSAMLEGQSDDEAGVCVVVEWVHGQEQHEIANDSLYDDWSNQINNAFLQKYGKRMADHPECHTDNLPDDVEPDVVIHRSDSDNQNYKAWDLTLRALVDDARKKGLERVSITPKSDSHYRFAQAWGKFHGYHSVCLPGKVLRAMSVVIILSSSGAVELRDAELFLRERYATGAWP